MPKQVILENDYASLWYDPELGAVHHQIKKFVPAEQMKELLNKGRETLTAKRATKWLSDDRANMAIPKDVEEWMQTNWLPQTIKAGWKVWAVVVPASVIGKMNIQKFVTAFAEMGVKVQHFTDPAEAAKWLAAQ